MPSHKDPSNPQHDFYLYIGDRIRTARKDVGKTLVVMAEEMGIYYQQLQKVEKGIDRPSLFILSAVATLTNREIDWFLPKQSDIKKLIKNNRAYRKVASNQL